jgi:hypothetical protein
VSILWISFRSEWMDKTSVGVKCNCIALWLIIIAFNAIKFKNNVGT